MHDLEMLAVDRKDVYVVWVGPLRLQRLPRLGLAWTALLSIRPVMLMEILSFQRKVNSWVL